MIGLAAVAIALAIAPVAAGQGRPQLEEYTLQGRADKIAEAVGGAELAGVEQTASGIRADAVLTQSQRAKVAASGVEIELTRNKKGQTVTEQAAAQAAGGYNVYRSWDEPGGIRDELYQVAAQNPGIVKLEVLGHTHQGRELIALKVTQGANAVRDGSRPAVLYSSNQHAREWISLEVNRRLLRHFMEHPGRVFSREQLLDAVWGKDVYVEARTVDVHIRRLRIALNGESQADLIRTVRAAGYALDATPG